MINANELRIGNWLHYKVDYYHPTLEIQIKHDKYEQVDTISYDHLLTDLLPDSYDINHNDRKNYSGIQLTPEILEKCGFEQQNGVMGWEKESVVIAYETLAKYFRLYPRTTPILYLHQLQNLFWCLCGEELNYKP